LSQHGGYKICYTTKGLAKYVRCKEEEIDHGIEKLTFLEALLRANEVRVDVHLAVLDLIDEALAVVTPAK